MAENDINWESIPFELTETDIQNIRLGDEHFVPHDWEELKNIIGSTGLPFVPLCSLSVSYLNSHE